MRILQDEVNEKTVSLCINGGKISARILKNALAKMLARMEQEKQHRKQAAQKEKEAAAEAKEAAKYRGKQSMEKLRSKNAELSNIEITDGNIRSFEKYARKYDIDYCLKKDRSADPPRYYVFFKAKDVDAMTAAFREYSGVQLKKSRKPLIRKKLALAKERAAKHREREKTKQKERGPEH